MVARPAANDDSRQARWLKRLGGRTGPVALRKKQSRPDIIAQIRAFDDDETKRDVASERRAMLRFLAYLKPSIAYFVMASLCGISVYLVPNIIPSAIGYVIDRILGSGAHTAHHVNVVYRFMDGYLALVAPHASRIHRAAILLGSIIAVVPFWAVLVFFRVYLAGAGGQRVIFKLRNDLYEHIHSLPLSFFNRRKSGSIVSRLTSDIALAQNFIGNACTNLWMDSMAIVLLGMYMLSLSWRLTAVAFTILPIWIISVRYFGQGIRRSSHAVQEGLSELSGQVQEKIGAVTVVQAFTRERHEMRSFHRLHHALLIRQLDSVRFTSYNNATSTMLTTMGPLTVMLMAAFEVITGRLSVGVMIMFWVLVGTFYAPLQRLTDLSAVIANAGAAIERIFQVFDIAPDITDSPEAVALPERIAGRIDLQGVTFGYDERPILKDIRLTIEPGEIVAFVGASGAGKSTLVQLIPRFYDVTAGSILIDGTDIRNVTLKSLRGRIGMVLQDNILFSGSIRDNILYGRPSATDAEVVAAAKMGNAYDFIKELPDGLDTRIGERGAKLSGGQKQRIAITRAFLRDPNILILDEATSALDSESEHLIQASLARLMVGRTTLIIAHRLSTIIHADKIVVMQKGRIVETGKHDELLAQGGVYAQLYRTQFRHLEPPHPARPKAKAMTSGLA